MSHQSGEYSWSSVLWAFTSLLGFFFPLFGNDMPFVIALFVFFRGDSCWFFVWQHRFAAHEILEAGRRKYEHEAEGLGSHGFYTYPGIRRNECDSSRVQIAFLVSHMNMSGSFFDQQNFILPQVFVQWYFVFGNHVFGAENQVLRAVVLRAHLQDKFSGRRLSPYPPLTFIFLQQKGFGSSLGIGCGTGLCGSSLNDENRNENHTHCHKRCPN